jgi:hypothetical protein
MLTAEEVGRRTSPLRARWYKSTKNASTIVQKMLTAEEVGSPHLTAESSLVQKYKKYLYNNTKKADS